MTTNPQKPLSEKPLGCLIAVLGGTFAFPLGWITSPFVLVILNNMMKGKEGKQPNRFLVWSLVGIIGAPISALPYLRVWMPPPEQERVFSMCKYWGLIDDDAKYYEPTRQSGGGWRDGRLKFPTEKYQSRQRLGGVVGVDTDVSPYP